LNRIDSLVPGEVGREERGEQKRKKDGERGKERMEEGRKEEGGDLTAEGCWLPRYR
jgi:hypothetical protein